MIHAHPFAKQECVNCFRGLVNRVLEDDAQSEQDTIWVSVWCVGVGAVGVVVVLV